MLNPDITAMLAGLAITIVGGGFAINAIVDEQPQNVSKPPVVTEQQQQDLKALLLPSEAALHPAKTAGPVPVNIMDFYRGMIAPVDTGGR